MDEERGPAGVRGGGAVAGGHELVLLYDGVCALCNGVVTFALARDVSGRVRFAPLQGAVARAMLARHGRDPGALDTVVALYPAGVDGEQVHERSGAVVKLLAVLGGRWRVLGLLLGLVPRALRDWGYDLVARWRYRVFGKFEACPLPDPRHADRFLDA